eukprot:1654677-Amphidinium_carterae.1
MPSAAGTSTRQCKAGMTATNTCSQSLTGSRCALKAKYSLLSGPFTIASNAEPPGCHDALGAPCVRARKRSRASSTSLGETGLVPLLLASNATGELLAISGKRDG